MRALSMILICTFGNKGPCHKVLWTRYSLEIDLIQQLTSHCITGVCWGILENFRQPGVEGAAKITVETPARETLELELIILLDSLVTRQFKPPLLQPGQQIHCPDGHGGQVVAIGFNSSLTSFLLSGRFTSIVWCASIRLLLLSAVRSCHLDSTATPASKDGATSHSALSATRCGLWTRGHKLLG